MDSFLESITGQLSNLGLGEGAPGKAIPPHLSEDIRTIQARALRKVLEASESKGSVADSQELVSYAHQLMSFTKHFLEDYHGKPDQADS